MAERKEGAGRSTMTSTALATPMSAFAGQDNGVSMTASIAVRNEPYGSNGGGEGE